MKIQNSKIKIKNLITGFTILELLVVMAIAAMILSYGMVNIREIRQKSRDTRREGDSKQIQLALALYANNKGSYPVCTPEVVIGSSADSCIGPVLVSSGAMPAIPADPLLITSGTCGAVNSYAYCYLSPGTGGRAYDIRYALEGDSIPGKTSGWQNPIGP